MALIHVPRPPKNAKDPHRPISSLLKAHVEHLHEAERKLPLHHRSGIYVNAIKTEGEAAEYIKKVTEAIHSAHEEFTVQRAAASKRPLRKSKTRAKSKGTSKSGRKKR
jgi:hypothetical protein